MKNPTSKLTRMRLDLEEFDFKIEFFAGKTNVVADALSRIISDSDELKASIPKNKSDISNSILMVNTRAMIKKNNVVVGISRSNYLS